VPEPIMLPVIFNDDNNVDALETTKLEKLVLLNIVVDVACKFDIFNAEYVDKLLNLLLLNYQLMHLSYLIML
jgi:hypothetical protein